MERTKRIFGKTVLGLLISIDLSSNNFSGNLPSEITNLIELVSLNVSFNELHGEILKDIGQLKYLGSLDLSRNEFSRNIPSKVTLYFVDLHLHKHVVGLQLLVTVDGKKDDEKDGDDFWRPYQLGTGVGFAAGFWGLREGEGLDSVVDVD
ncbi:leucine-rich repeat protein (mitochondrion) [Artemisia annua]|uniref:Leucine-rich repeat protein n=1 Tax=Artemisia annua TaxID=35608 RepID=A0A2U1NJ79_ARTAN|nr:leucine-rich repeat protein [Artemisia annua]